MDGSIMSFAFSERTARCADSQPLFSGWARTARSRLIPGIAEDITARKEDEELLQYRRATTLTGSQSHAVHDRCSNRSRTRGATSAAAVVHRSGPLKRVNDTLGHAVATSCCRGAQRSRARCGRRQRWPVERTIPQS